VLSAQSKTEHQTSTSTKREGNKGKSPAPRGLRKACQGQEIVAPSFVKVYCWHGCGATISCPSLFKRTKMVLFVNLLLNHIFYPHLRETPLRGGQAEEKGKGCFTCRANSRGVRRGVHLPPQLHRLLFS
jgi:hypothetical protein